MNKYYLHILNLALANGIRIKYVNTKWDMKAYIKYKIIHIMPVETREHYAFALHELGHILGPLQRSPYALTCEAGAWIWAKANALAWNPTMQAALLWSLGTYETQTINNKEVFTKEFRNLLNRERQTTH